MFRSSILIKNFFHFSQALLSIPIKSFIFQALEINPKSVEAGDEIDFNITVINKNETNIAYNLTIKMVMDRFIISNANCSALNQSFYSTANDTFSMSLGNLLAMKNVSCSIKVIIGNNLVPGERVTVNSALSYYHTKSEMGIYPLEQSIVGHMNVLPVIITVNSSSNLSRLQADDAFVIDVMFFIPKSISTFNVTINLPTYNSTIHQLQTSRFVLRIHLF